MWRDWWRPFRTPVASVQRRAEYRPDARAAKGAAYRPATPDVPGSRVRSGLVRTGALGSAVEEVGFGVWARPGHALKRLAAERLDEQVRRQLHEELLGAHLRTVALERSAFFRDVRRNIHRGCYPVVIHTERRRL